MKAAGLEPLALDDCGFEMKVNLPYGAEGEVCDVINMMVNQDDCDVRDSKDLY